MQSHDPMQTDTDTDARPRPRTATPRPATQGPHRIAHMSAGVQWIQLD